MDNELPIYHTTVAEVALRKSPYWQQMFSIKNIWKIMNDQDVIVSKGKESLSGAVPAFEHLILFDEETLSLGLKKGAFSPENDLDLAWVIKYARSEEPADLKGIDVFKFLAELALDKAQSQGGEYGGTNDKRLMI